MIYQIEGKVCIIGPIATYSDICSERCWP